MDANNAEHISIVVFCNSKHIAFLDVSGIKYITIFIFVFIKVQVFKYVLDDAYQGSVMLVQDDENAILPKNDFEFETDLDYIKLDEGLKDYAEWYYNEGAKKYGYVI